MLSLALRREGRFVMLREGVITSSRKFTGRTLRETLWLTVRLMARGMGGVRAREHTAFSYDGKR